MSEILDMYGDLWRMSEDNFILLFGSIITDSSYETLGGTIFKYEYGRLNAYNCLGEYIINDYEDLRKFFEDD